MLGPFTFTFTLESEEFEKFEKVAAAAAADLYQTMITTRAPDGANKQTPIFISFENPSHDLALKKGHLDYLAF